MTKTTSSFGIRILFSKPKFQYASKPKFQYVPKVIQPGKGNEARQSAGTTHPPDTSVLDSFVIPAGLNSNSGAGVGTKINHPISIPPALNIETQNPYDILGRLNTEVCNSSSIPHVELDPDDSDNEVYDDNNPTAQFMES